MGFRPCNWMARTGAQSIKPWASLSLTWHTTLRQINSTGSKAIAIQPYSPGSSLGFATGGGTLNWPRTAGEISFDIVVLAGQVR